MANIIELYPKNNRRLFVALLIVVIVSILAFGCSPSKYKAISVEFGTPPMTTQDSLWAAGRCAATFPPKPTDKPIVLPSVPDSSAFYKAIADSALGLKPTVIERLKIQYKDTCTTAISQYENGFNLGYQVGKSEGKASSESKFKILLDKKDSDCDSVFKANAQANEYLFANWRLENSLLKKANEKLAEDNAKLQVKVSKRNKIILIESGILLLILIYVLYRIWKNITTVKIK